MISENATSGFVVAAEDRRHTQVLIRRWSRALLAAFVATIALNVILAWQIERLREQDPMSYVRKAQLRFDANDMSGAVVNINEAVNRAPASPAILKAAADIYFQAKHWDAAVDLYSKAIAAGSVEEGVRTNMLWSLIELKQFDQAATFGSACVAEGFPSPLFPRYVSESYVRAGKRIEAIPHLLAALKSYPKDLYLLDQLRQAYLQAGDSEKAQAIADREAEVQAAMIAIVGEAR